MSRSVLALVASAVVAVLVIAVVLVFGVIPLPDFPSLAEAPDRSIPGTVAFFRGSGERRCLWTIAASGASEHRVTCRLDGRPMYSVGQLTWTPDGRLLAEQYEELGQAVVVIDPRTGSVLERLSGTFSEGDPKPVAPVAKTIGQDRSRRADGALVFGGSPQPRVATVTVRTADGASRTLLRVRGPRDYGFRNAQWSPDGRFILAEDSAGRLLVMDETGHARLLTGDSEQAVWFIPGVPTYTVDPAVLRTASASG